MDQDSNNPYERFSDDMLNEQISIMHSLGQHFGFVVLQAELTAQFDTLAARLLAASDIADIHRTQGAMKMLGGLIESNVSAGLRRLMIEEMKLELAQREEERLK